MINYQGKEEHTRDVLSVLLEKKIFSSSER